MAGCRTYRERRLNGQLDRTEARPSHNDSGGQHYLLAPRTWKVIKGDRNGRNQGRRH